MIERRKLTITDENNETKIYDILATFLYDKTEKNYIIYTDNKVENKELNIYAAIYDPSNLTKLEQINSKEEWDAVNAVIKKVLKTK